MPRPSSAHLYLGLLVLTVAAYLPLWNNGFVDFDDEAYVTQNPQVKAGLSGPGFCWAWTTLHGKYWQPLTWLSLQTDAHFFSNWPAEDGEPVLSPAAFHGQNLFWHTGSVLLLFGLLRRLTGAQWRSFLAAALFAVHPMHVESVAWAAERKDVLSTFFGLLAVAAYVRYARRPGWKRYLAVVALMALSLLAKPMLMTLPFVLLLLDYWPLRRLSAPASAGRLVLEKVPLFALAAAAAVVTMAARRHTGSVVPLDALPVSARLANALTAYGWYVGATFWPLRLAVLYPHPYGNWSWRAAALGGGMLLAVTLLCCRQARRRPWLIVGWLWFVGCLVPVIGLAQGGQQAWADRFTYWPHIGLFIATAWALGELAERFRLPAPAWGPATALVLGGLVALTRAQVGYWRDTLTLWERALAVTEGNARAHVNLGKYFLDRGRLAEAEAHFGEAARLQPDSPDLLYFHGATLLALYRLDEAAARLRGALQRDPTYADAWHNLGVTRLRQGRADAAARCFRRSLGLRPDSADGLAGLGQALWRLGKRREAVDAFRAALDRNPAEAEAWHGLGLAHLARGELPQATDSFSRALQLRPGLVKAHSDLGVALGRVGSWHQAAACQQDAVRLQEAAELALGEAGRAGPPDLVADVVRFRCRLAFALASLGNGPAAADAYRSALNRDPDWPRKFTARAWELATAPDPDSRDPHLAFELASQAAEAVGTPTAAMLDARAAAEAARGEYREAARTARQALERASDAGDDGLAYAIRARLRLYEQGRPFTHTRP